jgi:hypothetical protein
MFTREDGPFGMFDSFRLWLGKHTTKSKGLGWTLAELFNCPRCLSLWLAFLLSPSVLWPSKGMDIILVILGVAGLQLFMIGRNEE